MGEIERNAQGRISSSVVEYELSSSDENRDRLVLRAMFRNFAIKERSWWPTLKEIHIRRFGSCGANEAYFRDCEKPAAAAKNVRVVLPPFSTLALGTSHSNVLSKPYKI
ncbi:hypothetical protein GGR51DRAFT_556631 [Nemania sp. FL0031]|nr:hypothetical protein GGR51DRAFT_556631 [Nemania sp. FL0031]